MSEPLKIAGWGEMSFVKEMFFLDEEAVMQLHPPRSQYVNQHPNCLHLWRPQTQAERDAINDQDGKEFPTPTHGIPLPPMIFVGEK